MCDRILVLDPDPDTRQSLEMALGSSAAAIDVAGDAESALALLARAPVDVILCAADLAGIDGFDVLPQIHRYQPDTPVVLVGAEDTETLAADVLRRGAWAALPSPWSRPELDLVLAQALTHRRARRATSILRADVTRVVGERPIVAASDPMIALLELLDRTAGYKSTVLVTGERGSGKESLARALHMQSPRREAPFVVFDCAAHTPERMESALFGHLRELSESSAPAPRGHFADAQGGTLYLDGVDSLPPAVQITLLRTIQTEEIEPIGDAKPLPVDVRVVAASALDLEAEVDQGRFRQDLFDRLDVVRMRVPPLRERREDLPLLVDHHLARVRNRSGEAVRRIEDEALERLIAHDWPGNVRELEIAIERAALAAAGDTLDLESLEVAFGVDRPAAGARPADALDAEDLRLKPARQAFEARHILRALEQTGGNRTHAAKRLGISHRALLYKIKDYGLRD